MPKKAVKSKKSKAVKAVKPVKKATVKKPSAPKAKAKSPAPKKPVIVKKAVAQKPAKKNIKPLTVSAKSKVAKTAKVAPAKTSKSGKATKPVETKKIFGKPPFPIKKVKTVTLDVSNLVVKPGKNRHLGAKFLERQRKKLLDLLDHMSNQMQDVAHTNLHTPGDDNQVSAFGMHQADAGSDAYEKDFALSLLSQEQDALYEINAAIKRLDNNTYGICEMSGQAIPVNRLEAIPFARFTIECQSQIERENKGKYRWDTSAQFMDNVETFYEEEETEDPDEDPDKLKE